MGKEPIRPRDLLHRTFNNKKESEKTSMSFFFHLHTSQRHKRHKQRRGLEPIRLQDLLHRNYNNNKV